jgi:hypothetical protein
MTHAVRTTTVLLAALLLGACAKKPAATSPTSTNSGTSAAAGANNGANAGQPAGLSAEVTESITEEGLIRREIDLNGDGAPDIVNLLRPLDDERVAVAKNTDLNFDGKFDVFTEFDAFGQISRERIDTDFDGDLDTIDLYKDGARVKSDRDIDFDGDFDVFAFYVVETDGRVRLDRKESDTDGNGKIDLWERFDLDGKLIRAGRDLDNDGKIDERIE